MTQIVQPNPGSAEAVDKGCCCPVIDNRHGRGVPRKDGPQFWVNGYCPLHGTAVPGNGQGGGEW